MAISYEASLVSVTYNASGPPVLAEVCGLIPTALTFRDELGLPGMCEITTEVDKIEKVGKDRLLNLAATPTELWLRRGGASLVAAGSITGYKITGRQITITAPGLLAYLLYWLRDTDYAAVGLDQATIVQQLCDQWQAQAYGNDGIVTGGLTATGVTRDLTLSGRDGKYIMPVIAEMGGRNNGFDLSVDPNSRRLLMWSPRKGTDLSANVILDQRSIGTPDVSVCVAPGMLGSEVFASSSSTAGVTLTSIKSNLALRATFGRSYISRQFQDISQQTTLDDHAQRALDDASTQVVTLAPQLLPVPGFSYGDFAVGDVIAYDYDAGLGRQTMTPRVASIEVSMSSGRELLKVGLV